MPDILPDEQQELVQDEPLLFHLPTLWYPLFDIAHFICAALHLRKELGHLHTRQHPLASCTAMVISSFAGSFLTSLALGLPAVSPLQREDKVLLAVLVWLAVFFCPQDVFHSLVRNKMVYLLVCGMKEMYRVRKIVRGISLAQSHYPSSTLLPFLIGVLKGNGSGFIRPLTLLVSGVWTPDQSELLVPSITTRWCSCVSVAWILMSGKIINTCHLYNTLVVITVSIKTVQVMGGTRDTVIGWIWANTTISQTDDFETKDEETKNIESEAAGDRGNVDEICSTNITELRQKQD